MYVCLPLLSAGCTVSVVDGRLTRQEVKAAFDERDELIKYLATKIETLEKKGGGQ
jgi:hypothetical protein